MSPVINGDDGWLGVTSDDSDAVVLHRFFYKHADKIGKQLLSDPSIPAGKQAWDELCALLVDLGQPMEVPRLSNLSCEEHEEFRHLMARQANRNTASVEGLFVETDVRVRSCHFPLPFICSTILQDKDAVFVLLLSSIDVENLDTELFMYHIFKVCPY